MNSVAVANRISLFAQRLVRISRNFSSNMAGDESKEWHWSLGFGSNMDAKALVTKKQLNIKGLCYNFQLKLLL